MNWTDCLIIALLVFSCVAGAMRGLLREVISLVTWVAAVWIAWSFSGSLEPHLGGALADSAARPWAARALIFIAVLLIGAAIGTLVTHFVRLSLFSGLDRLLGVLFGAVRGIVVVGLLVMLCHAVRLNDESWYHESTLRPYAESAANVLRLMVGERKIPVAV